MAPSQEAPAAASSRSDLEQLGEALRELAATGGKKGATAVWERIAYLALVVANMLMSYGALGERVKQLEQRPPGIERLEAQLTSVAERLDRIERRMDAERP